MAASQANAVVLLSGGLDSATALAIAREAGFDCHALTFDYGQRHRIELHAANNVARAMQVTEHVVMKIDLRAWGGSALTADIDVPKDRDVGADGAKAHGSHSLGVRSDIPVTYVPARNTIFLSFALGLAEVRQAHDIFIGVNAVDYSGYPDCRPEFIRAFETTANLATRMGTQGGRRITIHAPLIELTKAQIILEGIRLGVDYGSTTSCYDPEPKTGKPCGHCDSCLLRATGFAGAGVRDPALGRVNES
jgi:7-cyano-7-deazaguanine synthase